MADPTRDAPQPWTRRHLLQACAGILAAASAPGQAQTPAQRAPGWPAWDTFQRQFVSDGGRVVSNDGEGGQTYSEGQAYALFFALVANDRDGFEKLLRWTEDNLCAGDITARLPAWLWGKRPDGTWGVIDDNAASDADLWIAYALAEAGRLWDDRRYRALSSVLAARIVREETADLPGLGPTLLPAPKGFAEGKERWRLNPSYMPLQVLQRLGTTTEQPVWKQLSASALQVIVGASPKGFAPDWTVYEARKGFTPDAKEKGQGTYNAIRVYLWAGMLHPGAAERKPLLAALAPMARLVRDRGHPPESIDVLSGQESGPAPSGFSAAMLPFLQASGDASALQVQQLRLQARPLRPQAYYEQCLALFGQGWMDGAYRFGPGGQLLPRWKAGP
ncbi:cellulose synthase complex periplasmic endoglucanase BcsZ [Paenacidovorax monticola]|uniref:cellulase n=1 Tax=Paenacidovorax monticola TaxID=1926868 RepID=A0A7H0HKI1_9BURK|nr:cellulose synthase complex periplasmic endoglucanase BcsZ [Paenacidovorax monticola]QNP61047.1 cellulase [Paenacidovorax monticola]